MSYSIVVITAILIHLILNDEYFRNKEEKNEINKAFKRYIWAALSYYIMDASWGIIYDLRIQVFTYIVSICYYLTMALTVVLLCRYVTTYLRLKNNRFGKFINYFGLTFGLFEVLILIVNHFAHIFFWIDEMGIYHANSLRYVALYIQVLLCVLLAVQTGTVTRRASGDVRKRYFTIFAFCVEMTAAIILQIVFPFLPIYTIGLILGISIIHTFVNRNEKEEQYNILRAMADIHYSMHLIDMSDFHIEKLEGNDLMERVVKEGVNAQDMLDRIVNTALDEDYIEAGLSFVDLSTLKSRLKNINSISMDAIDKNVGWLRISFIMVEADAEKEPLKVMIATQVINEDKQREEELAIKANRDELTGLFNRRAYEDDMMNYPDVPPELDFVYAAIDINGLKVVNDELGHAAGDDLIRGAAVCLKRTFGNYGRVYRTGGDEFVSMFFADEEHLKAVVEDLERVTLEWHGEFETTLSLSVGFATKREFDTETVEEMAKVADQRMYNNKALYYSRKGIDRRGQAAAHKALCGLYTKIIKINLSDDSYAIVNMDETERTVEKGFSNSISEWFKGFGESGQVHPDDLKEYLEKTDINYLKDFFNHDKTSFSFFYRRKYDGKYKQVMLEMIPADDYSEYNQSLFLYVKSIDK